MTPSRRHSLACAVCLVALSWGATAPAVIPLPPQICIANQPVMCNTTTGAILSTPHVYVVYWGWGCSSGSACNTKYNFPSGTNEIWGIEAMLTDPHDYGHNGLGGTRWLNRERQYLGTVVNSSNPGKVQFTNPYGLQAAEWFDDADPYVELLSTNPNGTTALLTMLSSAVNHFGLQNDPQAVVLVARPPGSQSVGPHACGYHGAATGSFKLPYADIDYQGLNNGTSCYVECRNGPLCATQTTVAHELVEAITDSSAGRCHPGGLSELPGCNR